MASAIAWRVLMFNVMNEGVQRKVIKLRTAMKEDSVRMRLGRVEELKKKKSIVELAVADIENEWTQHREDFTIRAAVQQRRKELKAINNELEHWKMPDVVDPIYDKQFSYIIGGQRASVHVIRELDDMLNIYIYINNRGLPEYWETPSATMLKKCDGYFRAQTIEKAGTIYLLPKDGKAVHTDELLDVFTRLVIPVPVGWVVAP